MQKKLKREKRLYWGDLSGVIGDLSGVSGNLDDCHITAEDRKKGIDIEDLIG
jgi:hypothetical protein